MKIAFLGTGLMGAHMARNLLKAGFDLTAWNRTLSKTEALRADGAQVASTAAEAVTGADVVISILADGPATGAVQSDPRTQAALARGAVWIDMCSAKPEEARAQSAALAEIGVRHLDAPVSGGTKGAEAGTLAIMVGGEAGVLSEVADLLAAMGRPVLVGPAGAGQLAKLANQAIVAVTISAVAEAMLLLKEGGADPAAVRDALKGGFADSTILQQHGARMTNGDFAPGGLSRLQLKDLDNVMAEAADIGITLPVVDGVRDRFARLCTEMGGGDWDHSALYLELRDRNGLPGTG